MLSDRVSPGLPWCKQKAGLGLPSSGRREEQRGRGVPPGHPRGASLVAGGRWVSRHRGTGSKGQPEDVSYTWGEGTAFGGRQAGVRLLPAVLGSERQIKDKPKRTVG